MQHLVTFLLIEGLYFGGISEFNDIRLYSDIRRAKPLDSYDRVCLFQEGVYIHGVCRRITGGEIEYKKYVITYELVPVKEAQNA